MKRLICFLLFIGCLLLPFAGFRAVAGEASVENLLEDDFMEEDFLDEINDDEIFDPLEPMNRLFFDVNDKLYFWVIKPVNRVYSAALPDDIRGCLANFFDNIASPVRLLNNLLQGDFEDAGVVLSRFVINTTFGIFGFCDAAYQEFDLAPRPADFGQTLGRYGVGEGLFLYLPVIGPSNARDFLGYLTDTYSHPVPYLSENIIEESVYYSVGKINFISLNPSLYDDMKKFSLDPYIAVRQAFYDYRRARILECVSNDKVPCSF